MMLPEASPETSIAPSGENARLCTSCPPGTLTCISCVMVGLVTSHSVMRPPLCPVASRTPLASIGEKARLSTASQPGDGVCDSCEMLVDARHSTIQFKYPTAMSLPSGDASRQRALEPLGKLPEDISFTSCTSQMLTWPASAAVASSTWSSQLLSCASQTSTASGLVSGSPSSQSSLLET